MSKYTITRDEFWDVTEYYRKDLDPKDFLDCENEDDLYDAIMEELWDEGPCGTEYNERYDVSTDIPKAFIEEWEKLKEESTNE